MRRTYGTAHRTNRRSSAIRANRTLRHSRILAGTDNSVKTDDYWDALLDSGLVSEETLTVVTTINGYSNETLDSILYAVAGLNDYWQLMEELNG